MTFQGPGVKTGASQPGSGGNGGRAPRNGGRGSRHHPPQPPLSKGGKGYAARSGSFQEETVAEARVTTPPSPPLARGGKVMPRAPALSRRERWPRHASSPPLAPP